MNTSALVRSIRYSNKSVPFTLLRTILLSLGAGLLLVQPSTAAEWQVTGSLNIVRYFHTATLLKDGKVLAAGGAQPGGEGDASAEIYDPARARGRSSPA